MHDSKQLEFEFDGKPEGVRGTLSLFFRARCACGIWKDVSGGDEPLTTIEFSDAMDAFESSGWTDLDTDPRCARCSETKQLELDLRARGRR